MRIGAVAKLSGVPAKTIRYYESIGLIEPAGRQSNGYRTYSDRDVETLRFISSARALGFSIPDVQELLILWRDRNRAASDVRSIAQGHVTKIDLRIGELKRLRATLAYLIQQCHGDQRPDCPILERLTDNEVPRAR